MLPYEDSIRAYDFKMKFLREDTSIQTGVMFPLSSQFCTLSDLFLTNLFSCWCKWNSVYHHDLYMLFLWRLLIFIFILYSTTALNSFIIWIQLVVESLEFQLHYLKSLLVIFYFFIYIYLFTFTSLLIDYASDWFLLFNCTT